MPVPDYQRLEESAVSRLSLTLERYDRVAAPVDDYVEALRRLRERIEDEINVRIEAAEATK